MSFFVALIEQYGLLAVFGCVFIAQLGIPVPAYPTLIIAGALLQHASYTSKQVRKSFLIKLVSTKSVRTVRRTSVKLPCSTGCSDM